MPSTPRSNAAERAQVRIIGGTWKGRKLRVASPAIRPSPERARVTLFNWLAAELPRTRVLDLFAGTGVLGFEALSRGADHATFIERDRNAIDHLVRHRVLLKAGGAVIEAADAMEWLESQAPDIRWDVVFLDPPFDSALLRASIGAVTRCLSDNGVIYAESGAAFDWQATAAAFGLSIWRRSRAGAVRYGLLRQDPAR